MASTLADTTAALQKLLLDQFRSATPDADDRPFLAFEPGTAIPDETFHLPPDNPDYSPASALEYMSHRANVAPRVEENVLFETSNRVDNLYEILLKGAMPSEPDGAELLGMVKRSACDRFDETLGSVVTPEIGRFHPTYADPVNWYDHDAVSNWTRLALDQADELPPSPTNGGTLDTPRSSFLLKWKTAPVELQPLLSARVSTTIASRFRDTRIGSPAIAVASPNIARIDARQWATPELRLPGAARVHEITSIDRRIGPELGNLQITPVPPEPSVTSDGFSISFEMCLVHLRRPWLGDGLLNLSSWFVPSVARGSFSGGTGSNESTPLAVLPIACILIRDLVIKARWNDDDRANLETSSHLGAFSLLGRSYDHDAATLTVAGVQSIAWICQPMPVLPPREPA